MSKYPILVQADKRGQIVIPKNIRLELGLDKRTGFTIYSVTKEGILLKKIKIKKWNFILKQDYKIIIQNIFKPLLIKIF